MQLKQIITGATGFVGGHLCRQLVATSVDPGVAVLDLRPAHQNELIESLTDIRSASSVTQLASQWSAPVVIHLAAMAEVVMPFKAMSNLVDTNVQGTINTLGAFNPKRIVFASSSAVYGSVHDRSVRPLAEETAAIGAYGVSKVMGEVLCKEWAEEHSSNAISLRFGNIIGPGCRGLIPYLVTHAIKHPDGRVPAELRGKGRIIRDYVPVEYAVQSILKAVDHPLEAGQSAIFNIGSGVGLSNSEVAHKVAGVLKQQGYQLALNFDNPIPTGESEAVVLDVSQTTTRLGVQPPSTELVFQGIEQATLWYLTTMQQADTD